MVLRANHGAETDCPTRCGRLTRPVMSANGGHTGPRRAQCLAPTLLPRPHASFVEERQFQIALEPWRAAPRRGADAPPTAAATRANPAASIQTGRPGARSGDRRRRRRAGAGGGTARPVAIGRGDRRRGAAGSVATPEARAHELISSAAFCAARQQGGLRGADRGRAVRRRAARSRSRRGVDDDADAGTESRLRRARSSEIPAAIEPADVAPAHFGSPGRVQSRREAW
jgi:hypothetical protein